MEEIGRNADYLHFLIACGECERDGECLDVVGLSGKGSGK